jgi:alpha-1,2-mannosyltransferase
MGLLPILLSLLVPALLATVFLPKTLRFAAELVGQHLRRSSRTRRELLLARVASETKTFEAQQKNKKKEDEDWEQVGNTPPSGTVKHGQADSEWDGIVGFFHPFWYAWHILKCCCMVADMLFLQQRRRRW